MFVLAKAEFKARIILVRERQESKEQEILGQWMTEEKMIKSGEFSKCLDSSVCCALPGVSAIVVCHDLKIRVLQGRQFVRSSPTASDFLLHWSGPASMCCLPIRFQPFVMYTLHTTYLLSSHMCCALCGQCVEV